MHSVEQSYLYAVGIHALDMVLELFGSIGSISAKAKKFGHNRFAINVIIEFVSGQIAFLDFGNYATRFESCYELVSESRCIGVVSDLKTIRLSCPPNSQSGMIGFKGKEHIEYSVPPLAGGYSIGGYSGAINEFKTSILQSKKSTSCIQNSETIYEVIDEIVSQIAIK
jgi:predicted dehydrogenase